MIQKNLLAKQKKLDYYEYGRARAHILWCTEYMICSTA